MSLVLLRRSNNGSWSILLFLYAVIIYVRLPIQLSLIPSLFYPHSWLRCAYLWIKKRTIVIRGCSDFRFNRADVVLEEKGSNSRGFVSSRGKSAFAIETKQEIWCFRGVCSYSCHIDFLSFRMNPSLKSLSLTLSLGVACSHFSTMRTAMTTILSLQWMEERTWICWRKVKKFLFHLQSGSNDERR
jgi:hypothetical protein